MHEKLDGVAEVSDSEPTPVRDAIAPQEDTATESAPATAQASPAQSVAEMTAELRDIRATLARLVDRMEADSAQLRRKDEIIASINSELQEARSGFVAAILRPLFEDTVRLLGDLEEQLALAAAGHTLDTQQLLQRYQLRLLVALENSGLYRQPPSDLETQPRFDPRTQVVARTVEVADPSQHQRIARVAMTAFHHDGKALLKERVDVFRYVKPAASAAAKETP